jgi:Raf kinase inhibitor-like YbhB/YbcL family protein
LLIGVVQDYHVGRIISQEEARMTGPHVSWILVAGSVCAPVFFLTGCGRSSRPAADKSPEGDLAMTIKIQSKAFVPGESVPRQHTGDGKDDPDAPSPEPWVHWVIYDLPGDLTGLPEGIPTKAELSDPKGAVQGKNSWGTIGYRGPAPPKGHGVHHYHFKLYALDAKLELPAGLGKNELLKRIGGHVLAQGELIGTYER